MIVLVDTSIWVDYFRGGSSSGHLDLFLDENLVTTNDLILAELIPFLRIKKENELIKMLLSIRKNELKINWSQIIEFQFGMFKIGENGVGISDLIIFQNAKGYDCHIYAIDSHFEKLCQTFNGKMIFDKESV